MSQRIVEGRLVRTAGQDGHAGYPRVGEEVQLEFKIILNFKDFYVPGDKGRVSKGLFVDVDDGGERFEVTWHRNGAKTTIKKEAWSDFHYFGRTKELSIGLGHEVQVLAGVSFSTGGKEYYRAGDKGRVSKGTYVDTNDGIERFEVTWYRSGLTSTMKKDMWMSNFCWIGCEQSIIKGMEVQALPGVQLVVNGKEYYGPGHKGTVSKNHYITQSDGIQRFEVTWHRSGLTSTMKSDMWLKNFRVTNASVRDAELGAEVQVLPGIKLIIEGKDYYTEGDKGRICRETYKNENDGIMRFEVTWYRTGLTSTMKKDMWEQNFAMCGPAVQPRKGIEVEALPGSKLTVEDKCYYGPGEKGRISRDNYVTASDGIERFEVTWYRSGLTSTMKTALWLKNFLVTGPAVVLTLGDEVEALPGIELIVNGKEYYKAGDQGRLSKEVYMATDNIEKFEVTWYRTGLVSTMKQDLWLRNFRFLRAVAAKKVSLGDEVETLPGVQLIADGKEFYKPKDQGRISKDVYNDKDGCEKFEVTWYRTGLTSTMKNQSWLMNFVITGSPHALRLGDEVEVLPTIELILNGKEYYIAGDKGRVSKDAYIDKSDHVEKFEIVWYRTGLSSTMKRQAWLRNFRYVGASKEVRRGEEVQVLPGTSLIVDGTEHFKHGDKGRVSRASYKREDEVECFEVTWYRTGLTSIVEKEAWLKKFRITGADKQLDIGDEVQVLPGIEQEQYTSGDKGRVTKGMHVDETDGKSYFDVTWYRTGLASKMDGLWIKTVCFTRRGRTLKKGDEVESLPFVNLVIEGKEYYKPGDKGRVTNEACTNEIDKIPRFEVTWYRTGLVSTMITALWLKSFRATGISKAIKLGDEVQSLPGVEFILNDREYYRSGDKGRVCRTAYSDGKGGPEKFEVTWYRTGLTSTMETGVWCSNFCLLGRAKQLLLSDEVQTLPGIAFSIEGKEYYRQGDTGRVTKNTYVTESDGVRRFEVYWPRTKLTSTMVAEKRFSNFRFIGTSKELSEEEEELEPEVKDGASKLALALRNYEEFHKLPKGSATEDQVRNSSAGIEGWASNDRQAALPAWALIKRMPN